MFKRFIKAVTETAKDRDLLSSRPHYYGSPHGQHQGWENDDKCCPNCGLVECTCDAQGLSESEKDDLASITIRSDGSWEYSRPGDCPTHCAFPDDVNIKVHQQRIGDLLVTIQEVK